MNMSFGSLRTWNSAFVQGKGAVSLDRVYTADICFRQLLLFTVFVCRGHLLLRPQLFLRRRNQLLSKLIVPLNRRRIVLLHVLNFSEHRDGLQNLIVQRRPS